MKKMKKMLFVFNPHSGKGQIGNHLLEIVDIFTKGGYEVTLHPTQAQLDGYEYISDRYGDFDVIVCSGGDGTLNEAIKAFMLTKCDLPLGYIPAGTMNDFASTLGISKDMPTAAHTIIKSEPVPVDIGVFNDMFFTYVAAFGIFTAVSYATDQQLKNSLGTLAYLIEAIRTQGQDIDKSYHIKIKCNDTVIEDDFMFGMTANSLSVGGIKGLAGLEDVWLDDGIFEGLFIRKPKTLAEMPMILNALLRREFTSPYLCYFKSGEFEIESSEPVDWTLDGEFGGTHKKVKVRNAHCAVKIFSGVNEAIRESN